MGGAASLLAALQATAPDTNAQAAGQAAPRGGLLAQIGSAAPPQPVQPAAPSLLATLGVPFAPLGAAPPAPAALTGLLRSLGAQPPPRMAPGGSRLAEVLVGLRPVGQG